MLKFLGKMFMALDKEGRVLSVPKPEKKSKTKSKSPPSKTIDMDEVIKKEERRKQNNLNRQFGKATERAVAKQVGGERTPMSGAIKHSNRNLTGDIEVKDAGGRDFLKIEVKATSTIDVKGDKMFTVRRSVLEQANKEAEEAGEIGCVVFHFKNDSHENNYYIWGAKHAVRIIELAKLGALVERGEYVPKENRA
jgi:hypothetical protein